MTTEAPRKETKTQRHERIKAERNPWEMLPDIIRFSREGFDSIPADDLNTRMRWWGMYTQGDGNGKFGEAVQRFMARIRLANGQIYAHQLRTIADLAERYGNGLADVTNRQNFQLHWLRIEDIPDFIFSLQRAGLTTLAACGDDTRNVTGCPLAGIDADEICDASPLAHDITRFLVGNADFYNLPRKYKISITGCRDWCTYPEINDLGITAAERVRKRVREFGFTFRAGGGLSTEPHFGAKLNAFIPWHLVVPAVHAVSQIYRDSDGLRQNRNRARLKYLFIEHGWTAEQFLGEMERRLGFEFEPAAPEQVPLRVHRDHVGVHPQKQPGLHYVGLSILAGRTNAEQLRNLATLADKYGDGSLRATATQNLVIINVPERNLAPLTDDLITLGFRIEGSPFHRGIEACTGSEFCKLALTETKGFARTLTEELERRLPDFQEDLKLNIAGCPNACGQHWIADIGFQGVRVKGESGVSIEAYDVMIGGNTGADPAFARRIKYRVPAAQAADAIERLLTTYRADRLPGEAVQSFVKRQSDESLHGILAGGATPALAGAEA